MQLYRLSEAGRGGIGGLCYQKVIGEISGTIGENKVEECAREKFVNSDSKK